MILINFGIKDVEPQKRDARFDKEVLNPASIALLIDISTIVAY